MKKHKKICTRTDQNLTKILLLKKDAKLVLNGKTRRTFTFFKTFREDFEPESLTEWSELF